MSLRQRSLVNRDVSFRDTTMSTKYLFPFWDRGWSVRFVLIEMLGGVGPQVYAGLLDEGDAGLVVNGPVAEARPLTKVPPELFEGTYHFDPWWVFRGGGVPARYRDAIVPTNIARTFRVREASWKVHDVDFGPRIESVATIEAKDESNHKARFTKSTLDLVASFGPAP